MLQPLRRQIILLENTTCSFPAAWQSPPLLFSAFYGSTSTNGSDVLEKLQKIIAVDRTFQVNNHTMGGDPCPGVLKHLYLEFAEEKEKEEEEETITAAEKEKEKETITSVEKNHPQTLCLYVFHEFNERVQYFLSNCIFADSTVDFVIIYNSGSTISSTDMLTASMVHNKIKDKQNCRLFVRPNVGFDFGGWSDALFANNYMYKHYKYFVFANSSISGPLVDDMPVARWTDLFVQGLTAETKLFGCTINTNRDPFNQTHVQSYLFAVDIDALEYLISCNIFGSYRTTFHDTIQTCEIAMSRRILENGWNIGCRMPLYRNFDFKFSNASPPPPPFYAFIFFDDIMYPEFEGIAWTKQDIVFYKGNRICLKQPV